MADNGTMVRIAWNCYEIQKMCPDYDFEKFNWICQIGSHEITNYVQTLILIIKI